MYEHPVRVEEEGPQGRDVCPWNPAHTPSVTAPDSAIRETTENLIICCDEVIRRDHRESPGKGEIRSSYI